MVSESNSKRMEVYRCKYNDKPVANFVASDILYQSISFITNLMVSASNSKRVEVYKCKYNDKPVADTVASDILQSISFITN